MFFQDLLRRRGGQVGRVVPVVRVARVPVVAPRLAEANERKIARKSRKRKRENANVSTNLDYDAISLMSGVSENRYEQMLEVEPDNVSARDNHEITVTFETKLKEPAMPKTSEKCLKLLCGLQHLDKYIDYYYY